MSFLIWLFLNLFNLLFNQGKFLIVVTVGRPNFCKDNQTRLFGGCVTDAKLSQGQTKTILKICPAFTLCPGTVTY